MKSNQDFWLDEVAKIEIFWNVAVASSKRVLYTHKHVAAKWCNATFHISIRICRMIDPTTQKGANDEY
jgi:hypothetical protein